MASAELEQKIAQKGQLMEELKTHDNGVFDSLSKDMTKQADLAAWQNFTRDERYRQEIAHKMSTREGEMALTDVEALMAVHMAIEKEIENLNTQIIHLENEEEEYTDGPIITDSHEDEILKTKESKVINRMTSGLLEFEDEEDENLIKKPVKAVTYEIKNGNNKLVYQKSKLPKLDSLHGGHCLDIHHYTPQAIGSNDCWAITMQMMLESAGIKMDYKQIRQYTPKLKKEDAEFGVDEGTQNFIQTHRNDRQSIHNMRGLFHDILGDDYQLEEYNFTINEVIAEIDKNDNKATFFNDLLKKYHSVNFKNLMEALKNNQIAANAADTALIKNVSDIENFLLSSLDQGDAIGCIFSGHYITIKGYGYQDGTLHLNLIDSTKGQKMCEDSMTFEQFMNKFYANGNIELNRLKKVS